MPDPTAEHPLKAVVSFFRSLKLSVVLILILTLLSVVASLIPQGEEQAFYLARYPRFGAVLIGLGFHRLFTSFLFLLPTALFFLNLAVCTIHRLLTRLRSGARRRFGPDILHIGLLVLLVGATLTFSGRTEDVINMRVGQTFEVPNGYQLELEDFQFERYEDGSPKDWLSVVNVTRNGEVVKTGAVIEVNSALKLGQFKFYQSSYGLEEGFILADLEGNRYWLSRGDIVPLPDDAGLVVVDIAAAPLGGENTVVFEVWEGHEVTGSRSLGAGSPVGEWVIVEVLSGYFTGLQMVHDPGYITVLVGLILLTIGLFLTYIQKIGDNQI